MINSTYLIKSRHDIFYFRYPLPIAKNNNNLRVSVSLGTCFPKNALRISKTLKYYSLKLLEVMDIRSMEHKDILLVFKEHYAEVLEKIKSKIDKNGILPKNNINNIKNRINTLDELINNEVDDELELLGLDIDKPEDRLIHKDMKAIMNSRSLNFDVDNEEYNMMK